MKRLLIAAVVLTFPLQGSQLGLRSVKQPLYLHGSDESPGISITDVPFVTHYADPEWRFPAICQPFVPPTDGSWKTPHDVNLASLYGITVSGTYENGSPDFAVTIDASKAKVPEGYPFTIAQVIDSVETCVKLMYPARPEQEGKLEIKTILAEE